MQDRHDRETTAKETPKPVAGLMEEPGLAAALDSEQFKQFLDHIPVAIAVAALHPSERVTYVNLEFERLSGQTQAVLLGSAWEDVDAIAEAAGDERKLCEAIIAGEDHLGVFHVTLGGGEGAYQAGGGIGRGACGKGQGGAMAGDLTQNAPRRRRRRTRAASHLALDSAGDAHAGQERLIRGQALERLHLRHLQRRFGLLVASDAQFREREVDGMLGERGRGRPLAVSQRQGGRQGDRGGGIRRRGIGQFEEITRRRPRGQNQSQSQQHCDAGGTEHENHP